MILARPNPDVRRMSTRAYVGDMKRAGAGTKVAAAQLLKK